MDDISDIRIRSKILARADRDHKDGLIKLRRFVGASQADVAEMLGVEVEWVRDLEAYDSDPRLSELRRYENIVHHLAHRSGVQGDG